MKAYFAGGCFWCITPVFNELSGVSNVTSGYSGGDEEAPTYEQVKSQTTGHRETVMIEYDPEVTPFAELVDVFLANVDPFDDGGQFIDRGHSYTLAIYCTDSDERLIAEKAVAALEQSRGRRVCVSVEDFRSFWSAEEYHQNYYLKNPQAFEEELISSGRKPAPDDV